MTTGPSLDPRVDLDEDASGRTLETGEFLHKQLAQASSDLMRGLRGPDDPERSGRPRELDRRRIIAETRKPPPEKLS